MCFNLSYSSINFIKGLIFFPVYANILVFFVLFFKSCINIIFDLICFQIFFFFMFSLLNNNLLHLQSCSLNFHASLFFLFTRITYASQSFGPADLILALSSLSITPDTCIDHWFNCKDLSSFHHTNCFIYL